ncbi:MAG: serine/threonine protein phosphatase PrpC [Paraglaciecola sp.]|jgi:serine/threonine protein phosphatase PrpC
MPNNNWISVAHTDIGTVRKVNEDDFLDAPQAGLWCVADGMGGHQKGDVASRMIVDHLDNLGTQTALTPSSQQVKKSLLQVNNNLLELGMSLSDCAVIGSTVAVLLFDQQNAHCIWAGDSRIYRLRQNTFTRLTTDHSQVQEMVDSGMLTPEQAAAHPSGNVITRAIGASDDLELDQISVELQRGDVFLLCSDGLNEVISDGEIANFLRTHPLQNVCDSLIQTALNRKVRDNVTVVTVCYRGTPQISGWGRLDVDSTVSLDNTVPMRR